MQARVALTELLSRCPDFEVDESGIVWAGGGYVRRPLSVPFRVTWLDGGQGLAEFAPRRGGRRPHPRRGRRAVRPHDVATVGMNDIARAAGCSRATLYRYFENREVLHTAYVHREAYRLHEQMTELSSTGSPIRGSGCWPGSASSHASWCATARRCHRGSPPPTPPSARRWPSSREVDPGAHSGFLLSLRPTTRTSSTARARWLVRVLTSLLIFPGHDDGRRTRDARGVRRSDGVPTQPTG